MKNRRYVNCVCLLMIVLLSVCSELRAENERNSVYSTTCKRFLLCTANAYGYIGGNFDSNVSEKRVTAAAIQLAKRKINTYLNNHLTQGEIYHFLPEKKLVFQVLSTKKIEGSQIGENLFGIQVSGMVEYQVEGRASNEFLTVSVESDKSIYHEGDELLFLLHGNQRFHMCLLEDASDNMVTQLLPNSFRPDDVFSSGQHLFPSEVSGDIFQFIVGPPFGQSTIHMFGSEEAIGGISVSGENVEDFIQTKEHIDTIRSKLMKNVIEQLELNDTQITFQCAQFVENQKKLLIKP